MKKLSVKKLLVLFTLIAMVCMALTTVKASSPINLLHPTTTTNTQTPTTANTQTPPTTTNTQTPATTNTITRTNTVTTNTVANGNQNSNLPQTGDASDYVIFLFIAVCAVVAIYAFRKYKNYNI